MPSVLEEEPETKNIFYEAALGAGAKTVMGYFYMRAIFEAARGKTKLWKNLRSRRHFKPLQ